MVYGDTVRYEEEMSEEVTKKPKVSLFTSGRLPSANQSSAINHRRTTTMPYNCNRPKTTTRTTSPSVMQPSFAGCSRNDECETFPSYNCSSNPLKSLTTTDCTTPRPVPCVKPNRTERVINSSPDMFADASDNDSVVEVDVSSPSYLEGIDIEAFFDDE